jgi:lysophospholipase L1-like esterase
MILPKQGNNRFVTTFRRYVAIGDSTTEGLEDPDGNGGYRGWADRLAQHIADNQNEPLEYANLAIRGYRMKEIRTRQFDDALAMQPDLLSAFGA